MMASAARGALQGQIDRLFACGTVAGMSDAELLERFTSRGEGSEAAFEAILARHGPMVLGVCHRILGDRHSAEDAFQATFLLLSRRSGMLRVRDTLGPWLHEVARRTACKARTAATRCRGRERRVAERTSVESVDQEPLDDLGAILHEEIGRLSPVYRAAVVVCYLEGRTHHEAAAVLGWPVGSVRGRLAGSRAASRRG